VTHFQPFDPCINAPKRVKAGRKRVQGDKGAPQVI